MPRARARSSTSLPGERALTGPTAGSPYRIELLDAAGALIASAVPATTSIEVEQAPSSTLLDATLPNSPAAASVAVTVGGLEIAHRDRSKHAPDRPATQPPPGCEARPCQGDPDPLARTRRRQRSAARDRELLRRPRPSLESHRRSAHRQLGTRPQPGVQRQFERPNPRHGQRRLQPHDRDRRTPSGTRRPTAGPDHPLGQSSTLRTGQALLLQGTAFDDADNPLTGSHLRWYANKRPIGRGALLTVRHLHPGPTTITLTATDDHDLTATATLRIKVLAPNPVLTQAETPPRCRPPPSGSGSRSHPTSPPTSLSPAPTTT